MHCDDGEKSVNRWVIKINTKGSLQQEVNNNVRRAWTRTRERASLRLQPGSTAIEIYVVHFGLDRIGMVSEVKGQGRVSGQRSEGGVALTDRLHCNLLQPQSPDWTGADWSGALGLRWAWPRGSGFAALDQEDWRYQGNRCSRHDPSAFFPQTSAGEEKRKRCYCCPWHLACHRHSATWCYSEKCSNLSSQSALTLQ